MPPRRVIILVLDGLGIGALPDADPTEADSDTLGHIVGAEHPNLEMLAAIGLGVAAGVALTSNRLRNLAVGAAIGRSGLGYPGADTYLGHLTMLGASGSRVSTDLLDDSSDRLLQELRRAGHVVRLEHSDGGAIVVDELTVVADNVEAQPGLSLNVTGSLDSMSFEAMLEIGTVVRRVVRNPRVIVVGGTGYGINEILASLVTRSTGQRGVDTPRLGVYASHFELRHLGGTFDTSRLVTTVAHDHGVAVDLIGKAADVIDDPRAWRDNVIDTQTVFDRIHERIGQVDRGLVIANVQELDIAGHDQNTARAAGVLELIDRNVGRLITSMASQDVLIVTADHGNDPTTGHSLHTREYVPVLAIGRQIGGRDLGTREGLGDIGATAGQLLGLPWAGEGRSFVAELAIVSTRSGAA